MNCPPRSRLAPLQTTSAPSTEQVALPKILSLRLRVRMHVESIEHVSMQVLVAEGGKTSSWKLPQVCYRALGGAPLLCSYQGHLVENKFTYWLSFR